jgi:SAM-dependent methyltransferase
MRRFEYDKLDHAEGHMWWFAALHENLLLAGSRAGIGQADLPVLDAGCGTGGFLARLGERYRAKILLGIDLDPQACLRAATKSARPVCTGSVNALPFADGSLAAIFSADVLCHRGVDEALALRHFHRCLAKNGCLILNLPAYRWMLSRHDAAVSNIRRYTATGLRALLQAFGFRIVYLSYWNAVLLPLMIITRKLFPSGGASSDVKLYPRPAELLCRAATGAETALLRRDVKLPFGGSILAIARKDADA